MTAMEHLDAARGDAYPQPSRPDSLAGVGGFELATVVLRNNVNIFRNCPLHPGTSGVQRLFACGLRAARATPFGCMVGRLVDGSLTLRMTALHCFSNWT